MSALESYKKQAKLLLRWHRDGNRSVGGRIRQLQRYRTLTDVEALSLKFPLAEAQEIVAKEAGHDSWTDLKTALSDAGHAPKQRKTVSAPGLTRAVPVLYVADVAASAAFFRDKLGFTVDFLHGHPAFYGSVSRDGACLHLKFVHEGVFADGAREREGLIMAFVGVDNVKGLYAEYQTAGVRFSQPLTKEAWGGTDFCVVDPDGNVIAFVG